MDAPDGDVAAALAEAARGLYSHQTVEQTLDAIVHAARASIPGFDAVGISVLHADKTIETKAATGQLVWDLDAAQYGLMEGPCVDALFEEPVVVAEHLQRDERWPRFVPVAVSSGVLSQLAVKLYTHEGTLGGLNMYSTTSERVTPEAAHLAELFGSHAALALGHVRLVTQLSEGMQHRQDIGIATGLVMARYQIDRNRAFQFLVRASSTSNVKVRDVAREVVADAEKSFESRRDGSGDRRASDRGRRSEATSQGE